MQSELVDDGLIRDEVIVIETNLDDVTGELLGWLMARLLAAGALDVSYTAMQMKKNRPATLVRVIARPGDADRLAFALIRDTPTLGVRMTPMQRLIARRREETVISPLGAVAVKLKLLGERIAAVSPEFDDCERIAATLGLPLGEVMGRINAWLREHFQLDEQQFPDVK